MAVEQHEHVEVHRNGDYVQKRQVIESSPSTQAILVSRITKLTWLVFSVIEVLIAFRLVLQMIGANPGSGFVNFIYSLTQFLVAPFLAIVPNITYTGGVIEVASIFALVVYPILGWIIVRAFRIIFADSRSNRSETTVLYD